MKKYLIFNLFFLINIVVYGQDKFRNPNLSKTKSGIKSLGEIKLNLPDNLQVDRDENGMPIFIKGKIISPKTTKYSRGSMESKAFGYLESVKETIKINAPQNEFQITNIEKDELNQEHIRMDQTFKGLKVYGGEMILHSNGADVDKLNGRFFPTPSISNVSPKISIDKAIAFAQTDIKKVSFVKELNRVEKSILKYEKPKAELIIYHENEDISKEKLAWKIEIRPNFVERWEYFVDAISGKILSKFNHTCALDGPASATAADLNNISRSIKTYQSGTGYVLIDATKDMFPGGAVNVEDPSGVIWTIDASDTTPEDLNVKQVSSQNNAWSNRTAVSAHYNAGIAYDYYKKAHNRLSLNGKGGTIISIINITETNEQTGKVQQMDNAFWNGEFMGYGNGNTFFRPLAGGLDVAGHEMTHGVIENTANLNYQGQSGAINESMADVFGVLIDRQDGDFVVGEDVMKNGKPFLRSLSDPNKGDQPAHMNERYTGTEDNGGVHINSGIPNRAFYLFVTALSGNEETKKAKAEKVYYRALTKYLTRSSKFIDLRAAIIQSCTDLAAEVGAEAVTAANNAFDAVGIGSSGTSTPTQKPVEDLPTNNGAEFILSYDPCDKDIYLSKEIIKSEADYRVLVNDVNIDHKPSVTDDGSFAYYVAKKRGTNGRIIEGGTINRVNLTGTPKIDILSKDEVWKNVAVSKDGLKLAAVTKNTTENDEQYIYIFDLTTGKSQRFKLYNPTYSQTLKSAGQPLFADALEWEYNGEYLIYDAFNEIKSNTFGATEATNAIQYWDVGILKAWDVANKTFADGSINKIFTNLAKNESIGNPSFAKKSTSVIAFDRLFNDKNSILTIDFESKGADGSYKRAEIQNNTIGFPEFSAKDDKLIFNREISKQKKCVDDSTNTSSISLTGDKVTPSGSIAPDFIITSSLAVWYTVGKRALPTKAVQVINVPSISAQAEGSTSSFDLNLKTDKSQAVTYKMISGPAKIENGELILTGKPGKVKVQANADGNDTLSPAESTFEFCVNPAKPSISVTELANAILLQSSDNYTNEWFADGVLRVKDKKGIEITDAKTYTVQSVVDGCRSEISASYRAGAAETQTIAVISVTDKLQGDTGSVDLPAKTDKGNNITYTVVSGPAVVVGNKLTLTGQPGRVKVKGFSPAGLKFAAVETTFEFCVNPSKPTISVVTQIDQYVFTSSALTGNNWYRNNLALNVTDRSINVVTTNSFTVQVIVEGCKSEFSDARVAPKEIVLAEEAMAKAGISFYPNPMADMLYLKFGNTRIDHISLNNLSGIPVFTKNKITGNELNIDLKAIPKGIYLLKLNTNKGEFLKKLLKE